MRLTTVQAIQLVSSTAFAHRPPAVGFLPVVDPRLRVAYCPRIHSPAPQPGLRPADEFWGHQARLSGPWADHGPPGLVGCTESGTRDCPPRRNGLRGLTQYGRKRLQSGACLLEEQRRLLSFWTITLPDSCLKELLELGTWQKFQDAIRHRLVLALRRRGLVPLVIGVVELHPQRSMEAGQALPHLHVLFRGARFRAGAWALRPADLDGIILQALRSAGVVRESVPSAGKVEVIRRSVRRYLSKYVAKPSHVSKHSGGDPFIGDPSLCPRQWWFMSRPLLEWIEAATAHLPPEFLAWLCDNRTEPRRGAPYVVQRAAIPDPRAPSVWVVSFRSPWTLFQMWESYERALILGERLRPRSS